ncbi:MAG: hypothetical protein P9M14_17225 [Candidatus Alcyoniella australis]|nr:hypothetical protein [Candidatus Alcyoniella australis]
MMTIKEYSYSELTQWRTECFKRFHGVFNLPIVSPGDKLREYLGPDSVLLDVGAGHQKVLKTSLGLTNHQYFSMDDDPVGEFNFDNFSDIPETLFFDIIVANQLLEHLTISEAIPMMQAVYKKLKIGGHFIGTVPNAQHPVRQWGDATHVTAWPLGDLYGLLSMVGFSKPQPYRYTKRHLTRNPIERFIVKIVSKNYRIDWCDSLMIVGRKND